MKKPSLSFDLIPGKVRTRCWNVVRRRGNEWIGRIDAPKLGGRLVFYTMSSGLSVIGSPTARELEEIAAFMRTAPTTKQLLRAASRAVKVRK